MATARKFDHDAAVRRRAAGETYREIAETYGVTPSAVHLAVRRATDPAFAERERERAREWQREHLLIACSNACGRSVWSHTTTTGLCQKCSAIARSTTARPGELRCSRCEQWKPDVEFPHQERNVARRRRHSLCRPCSTIARQERRELFKRPCVYCGALALPPSEKGPRSGDTYRCRDCFMAQRYGRLDERLASLEPRGA